MAQRILIIGITGGAGRETAQAALSAGFRVRAMHRDPRRLALDPKIEVIQGDAMNADDVIAAASDCDFILHAANPPQYRNWQQLVMPMAMNAAKAAQNAGARLLIPGNVYNFDPKRSAVIMEGAAHSPISEKGQVRATMEEALKSCGVRLTILRAGDFFGPHAPSAWFQTVMVTPGKAVRKVTWPGTHAGHAFAYLPDLAQTFVRLMQEDAHMADIEDLNFAGHYFTDGYDFARAIAASADIEDRRISRLPWAIIGLARPFVPMFREIWEMRYLWQMDLRLDNRHLRDHIGTEPHTELFPALKHSLAELGCIKESGLEQGTAFPIVGLTTVSLSGAANVRTVTDQ